MLKKLSLMLKEQSKEAERFKTIFGIFGLLNYPIFYIVWTKITEDEHHNLSLRIIAAVLCLGLIFRKYLVKFLGRYHSYYWLLTVTYCLPFFCSYMYLLNEGSNFSITNIVLATFMMIMLLNWYCFVISIITGTLVGILYYRVVEGAINLNYENTFGLAANILWVVLVCIAFSYTNDVFEKNRKTILKKTKNQ